MNYLKTSQSGSYQLEKLIKITKTIYFFRSTYKFFPSSCQVPERLSYRKNIDFYNFFLRHLFFQAVENNHSSNHTQKKFQINHYSTSTQVIYQWEKAIRNYRISFFVVVCKSTYQSYVSGHIEFINEYQIFENSEWR